MARALPKATRVGEFISMWAITKNRDGVATVETVAEMWGEAERTMYRRLEEFREVWEPAGYDTPDPIADVLIADYRARKQKLSATQLPRLSIRVACYRQNQSRPRRQDSASTRQTNHRATFRSCPRSPCPARRHEPFVQYHAR